MNIPSKTDNMKQRLSSREILLYSMTLILALSLRLYNLGAAPLSDYEAGFALQALQAAHPSGVTPVFGPHMTYISLTSPLFFLFNNNNFVARLWPALAGSLLVCLPILLRRRLGRGVALILAFGLAFDPGLVTISRLADDTMLALVFGLLALALWDNRQFILAGISGALALLCGPAILNGLITLALTGVILHLTHQPLWSAGSAFEALPANSQRTAWRNAGFAAMATIVLAGTLFLLYPQGIAAWAGTLPAYLAGWANSSGIPAGILLLALFVYQPAAVLLAMTGVFVWLAQQIIPAAEDDEPVDVETPDSDTPYPVILSQDPVTRMPPALPPLSALLWVALGLLLAIIYPGRAVSNLVWVLVPVWLLAAWTLHTHLQGIRLNPVSLAHSGLLLVLCTLFWMTLIATRLIEPIPGLPWPLVRIGVLLVVLVLGSLISALIAMGWSWPVSRDGMALGLGTAFLVYTIGAMWGAAHLRPNMPEELWGPLPAAVQVGLLTQTLDDLSKWQTGLPDTLDIVSLVDTPALRWALRNFPQTSFLSEPPPGKQPSVVITTQDQSAPELAASYRGQDFLWSAWRGWESSLPPDFVTWLAFRKAPRQTAHIILWMRADLKPAGSLLELPAESPEIIPDDSLPPAEEEGPMK